ncbi:MAG: nuclear transport factor 2 family protein, partial [candidate division WOR-3 bacterium]|nr:nuclear transport factor 2 family protein [candidate division WOR-3 bacterium]
MKYITLVSFMMLVAIIGCKPRPVVDMDAEIAAINTLLGEYVKSVETENMELYAKLVSHDTTMINFGSFGKPIRGWDALVKVMEGQNELLSDTKISTSGLKIYVSADGKMAWARCLWTLKAKMADNPV